ncbi:MAG: lytic transglycosylase domain-containing protein [Thermacetogeniaceae bacterium]
MTPIDLTRISDPAQAPVREDRHIGPATFGITLANRFRTMLEGAFQAAGSKYNLDPALLKAIAAAESSFDPNAVSAQGASGLMQIMPDTASSLGVDPRNPGQSILGAAKYLRALIDDFQGNLQLAIAAYNAGPGAVKKYNGIPPYKETQDYVNRVIGFIKKYQGPAESQSSGGKDVSSTTSLPQDASTMAETLSIWTQLELYDALSNLK